MDILGPMTLLMAFIAAVVVYIFFAFPPAFVNKKTLNVFNSMVMAVAALFCIVYIANIAVFFDTTALAQYKTLLMIVGVCGILTVYLTVFFVLRNFWMFKSRRLPGL